jgi:hypothetical protein
MNTKNGAFTFILVASLGLACGGTGLKSDDTSTGGQAGLPATGGSLGLGGTGAGGATAGTTTGFGGSSDHTGDSTTGGKKGTGGALGSGGYGGSSTGGPVSGGTGGTTCPPIDCPAGVCPWGYLPNPTDPCGCPICASPDAGIESDATPDGPCIIPPCVFIDCPSGYELVPRECSCPVCVPVDAGTADASACPPVACPAIRCAYGTIPSSDPCDCPTCALPDAGTDSSPSPCSALDECACADANGCAVLAEACYCPFPQCNPNGACICGGGKFVGCVPAGLDSCPDAKARVADLCPSLAGPVLDDLCDRTDDTLCITKCLDELDSCSDIFCSLCVDCDCAVDDFSMCVAQCRTRLAQ